MPPPLACFEDVKARITNAYQNVVEEMTPEQEEDMQQEEQDVLDFVTPVDTQRSEEVTDMPVTAAEAKSLQFAEKIDEEHGDALAKVGLSHILSQSTNPKFGQKYAQTIIDLLIEKALIKKKTIYQ